MASTDHRQLILRLVRSDTLLGMDEVLARMAREHSGVVAREDALAAGMTYDAFEG